MRRAVLPLLLASLTLTSTVSGQVQTTPTESIVHPQPPAWRMTQPGQTASYVAEQATGLRATQVASFTMGWTAADSAAGNAKAWLFLRAAKADGTTFQVWLETSAYPAETPQLTLGQARRYLVQQGEAGPLEYRHVTTGQPVLPSLGGWSHAWPRALETAGNSAPTSGFPARVRYLGHPFRLAGPDPAPPSAAPTETRLLRLRPDALVGVPSNTRTRRTTRRYDGSDDERVRLGRADFVEMVDAGMNCLRVDAAQRPFIDDLPVFYWGVGAGEVAFPECLYDSRYLGPALFLDEPAVHTRDHVLRPRLAQEPAFRRAITPAIAFEAFRDLFQQAWQAGAANQFQQGLAARADVDPGAMRIRQANLYSWETMISTAGWQLSQDPVVPAALVFEPPGRVGTRRTLPELNMAYGCQIPVTDPSHFIDIIYGFLRGAARLTGKPWGTSIYGAVDRADAPWFLTRAYDLGATHFFFWDNAGLACVPYAECLALARQLKMRMENEPPRDLERLRQAAEVLILVPVGYNLGHVHLGKGSLWGITELNLERTNTHGLRYRQVMGHVFTEIERCLRLGIGFDLLWDLPGPPPTGYREVVRIREDGRLDLWTGGRALVLNLPRTPERPAGRPPALTVTVSTRTGPAPLRITARAQVTETEAPVYYTLGTDPRGIYHNAAVAWELFGPEAEDYQPLTPAGLQPRVEHRGRVHEATMAFSLDRPGTYRLRAATADLAGRTAVEWTTLEVAPPANP